MEDIALTKINSDNLVISGGRVQSFTLAGQDFTTTSFTQEPQGFSPYDGLYSLKGENGREYHAVIVTRSIPAGNYKATAGVFIIGGLAESPNQALVQENMFQEQGARKLKNLLERGSV